MPFTPTTKNPGDLIKSQDWNNATDEIVRLENSKVTRSGSDTMSGPLHITTHMNVGSIQATSGTGGIDLTGPGAELGLVDRDLTSWPSSASAGDRFVWYNKSGIARLWTHQHRDLIRITKEGTLRFIKSGSLIVFGTNESGTPSGDGIRFRYDGNFFGTNLDAFIIEKTDGNQADPDGGIAFVNTGDDGTVEPSLVIRGNGRVGIGVTSPSQPLHVEGNALKTAGGSAWSTPSDERLKEDIQPLKNALSRLSELRGVSFEWKDPVKQRDGNGRQMGLIGQEVEKIFPEWVDNDEDSYKILTMNGFEALAIESFKELQQENHELKARLKSLEDRIEKLEQKLSL